MTEKEASATFPRESDAVKRTMVIPTGKRAPGAGRDETETDPSTKSMAFGNGKETMAPLADVAGTVWFGGSSTKTGGELSRTTTTNGLLAALTPLLSRAINTSECVPIPSVTEASGVLAICCPWLNHWYATLSPSGSVAVPDNRTTLPEAEVASTGDTIGCTRTTGARLTSTTVTIKLCDLDASPSEAWIVTE